MSETNETNETPKRSKTPSAPREFSLSENMLRALKALESGDEWRDLMRALLNYYFAEIEPPQEIEPRARFAFFFLKGELDERKAREKQLSEIRRAASLKAREREKELREKAGKAEKTRELGRERLRKFRENRAAAQAQEQASQETSREAPSPKASKPSRAPKTAEEIEAKKEARRARERERLRRKRAEAKARKALEA